MAGGSMKDIKRRIKSIESTGQITKAMELVASSKLRRAKERAQNAQPYFNTLYKTICEISTMNEDISSIYTHKNEAKSRLFIVIAGDRGLAGGYNSNLFKLANAAIKKTIAEGKEAKVIAIGKKAVEHYDKRGMLTVGFPAVAERLDLVRTTKIAEATLKLFDKREVDEVFLYYTQFISALSQEPFEMKVLPLSNISSALETTKLKSASWIYEPSPEAVFNAIVPDYIIGMIYGAVVESFASEQGARRTAMESASDNATEMIDKLSLKYNRARQASITQEISEIVSGSRR